MKANPLKYLAAFLSLIGINCYATIHYVNINSTNPVTPYTDWTTAAINIQDAIDASTNGDTVLVTNGVYTAGGRAYEGGLTNVATLTSALTVQSVNGPLVTIIQGVGTKISSSAVRCAWLTNNATLAGFTLRNGATLNGGTLTGSGGGVLCSSSNSLVENCMILSNNASEYGCAAYQGTLINCFVSGNGTSPSGVFGAVTGCALVNCTVVSNFVTGVSGCTATNCILYYNANNYAQLGASRYCCTTPSTPGAGNFTNAPLLFADGIHQLTGSPCIGAGTNLAAGTDIFGNAWSNPPSVGCAEYTPSPLVTQPMIIYSNNPSTFAVSAYAGGPGAPVLSWLKDGVPLQDDGHFNFTETATLVVSNYTSADAGNYQIAATSAFGATTSAVATLSVHYVNAGGANPLAPYTNWAAAATNIQDAITASGSGDLVIVTNGTYAFGTRSMDGVSSNRVSLNNAIRVQSANGPFSTIIRGGGETNGSTAVRCAWLTNGASLVGFTLTAGATPDSTQAAGNGGGVYCASDNAYVDNCIVISNATYNPSSGAVFQGTLNNCLIATNNARSAVYGAFLCNCTVVSNQVYGVSTSAMTNCIVYYNGPNTSFNESSLTAAAYCCVTPAVTGTGNITNAPQFQLGGVNLSSASPCIHAGTNLAVGTDLFGLAWADPPSIGCAEFNGFPMIGQPVLSITSGPIGFTIGLSSINGQFPFSFEWLDNGQPVPGAVSSNLTLLGANLAGGGSYQLVVSNSLGAITSAPIQLPVHLVSAAGTNPVPPYSTWDMAATNIQDAIEAAVAGDIVLVTNGIYAFGGEVISGQTNRVALDKAIAVTSVNGWSNTVIQGAYDPVSTNGPAAVRCAWLTNGATLYGFTLANGATVNSGSTDPAQCGGGVFGTSTNTLVSNCLLTNNTASYGGGGVAYATLRNSLVINNIASVGGGTYNSPLYNCTIEDNYTWSSSASSGAGVYAGILRNCIVQGNLDGYPRFLMADDFYTPFPSQTTSLYSDIQYAVSGGVSGAGDISKGAALLDAYHLSVLSPCYGTGSSLYTSGVDFEGQAWSNSPSMGCDEVVLSNRVGPLSVSISSSTSVFQTGTNILVFDETFFVGTITGKASWLEWNFGDGTVVSNSYYSTYHEWTVPGSYLVTFTAYNEDNPGGVSATLPIQVVPVEPVDLLNPIVLTNGIKLQFVAQTNASYNVQYTTNLAPPVTWSTLTYIFVSPGGLTSVLDPQGTNGARYYRIDAQ